MAWTKAQKDKADQFVEVVFDDIHESTTNVALWFHANEKGEAALYITRDTRARRQLLISSLVDAFSHDADLLADCVTAAGIAIGRGNGKIRFTFDDFDDLLPE
jgi:hypothetical protein